MKNVMVVSQGSFLPTKKWNLKSIHKQLEQLGGIAINLLAAIGIIGFTLAVVFPWFSRYIEDLIYWLTGF